MNNKLAFKTTPKYTEDAPLLVQRPSLPSRKKLDGYIDQIYESKWVTNFGSLVKTLEDNLRHYLKVPYFVLTSSGTSSLQLALKLYNIEKEVITSPFTFAATGQAINWVGATPVYADINPHSLALCPLSCEQRLSKDSQAIMPVNIYGNSHHNEELNKLATNNNLKVIYDAAQSFGPPSPMQRRALLNGDAACLSFHATKIFSCVEGGGLILHEESEYKAARAMSNFGFSADGPGLLGTNAKMNEFEAAFGLASLDDVVTNISYRESLTRIYQSLLSNEAESGLVRIIDSYNFTYLPIMFDSERTLLRVDKALKRSNIFGRRYFHPLQPGCDTSSVPIALDSSERIYCLPLHSFMENEDVEEVCAIVKASI